MSSAFNQVLQLMPQLSIEERETVHNLLDTAATDFGRYVESVPCVSDYRPSQLTHITV